MISYSITVDASQFAHLKNLDQRVRVPAAKALTFTAMDARDKLKLETASEFVLRRDWVPRGIRFRPANGGNLMSVVGSIDKYMERHVVGAGREKQPDSPLSIRKTRDSRGRLASGGILIEPYGSIGSAKIHTVVRRRLTRMDTQKRKTFQIVGKGGKVLIVRRTSQKRYPLQPLAVVQAGANIAESWDMFGSVRGIVAARFEGHFLRAMARIA